MSDTSTPAATIVYRGEHGPGWVPESRRHIWDYGVKTGQIVVPVLDDGGPSEARFEPGDAITVEWVPPEYAGRLKAVEPPPQPTYFALSDEEPTDEPE